jgi:hypothetical protein
VQCTYERDVMHGSPTKYVREVTIRDVCRRPPFNIFIHKKYLLLFINQNVN